MHKLSLPRRTIRRKNLLKNPNNFSIVHPTISSSKYTQTITFNQMTGRRNMPATRERGNTLFTMSSFSHRLQSSRVRAAIAVAGAIFALAACVPAEEPWTRERQEAVTQRSYANTSPRTAIDAAETVIRRIEPSAVSFEFTSDGFEATRNVYAFVIFGEIGGNYRYSVRARPAGSGTVLEFRTYANLSTVTTTGTYPAGGGALIQTPGAYQLFFARTDNLLGRREAWITCKEAPDALGVRASQIEPLCFGARDSAQ